MALTGQIALRLAVRSALASGLAAQVTTVNTTLTAEGLSLQLPAPVQIALRAQLAQYPSHLPNVPAVHVTPGQQLSNPAPGGTPSAQVINPFASRVEVGSFLLAPAAVDGLDQEEALLAFMGGYRDAVLRVLTAKVAQGGVVGAVGITAVRVAGATHQLWQVNYKEGAVVGGLDRVTLEFQHEHAR